MTTHLRVLLVVAVIATLWRTGETCTVGASTPDSEACNRYFVCIMSGAATMQIRQECPAGKNFDPDKGYCRTDVDCLICD